MLAKSTLSLEGCYTQGIRVSESNSVFFFFASRSTFIRTKLYGLIDCCPLPKYYSSLYIHPIYATENSHPIRGKKDVEVLDSLNTSCIVCGKHMICTFHLMIFSHPPPRLTFIYQNMLMDIPFQNEIFGYLTLIQGKGNGELISSFIKLNHSVHSVAMHAQVMSQQPLGLLLNTQEKNCAHRHFFLILIFKFSEQFKFYTIF